MNAQSLEPLYRQGSRQVGYEHVGFTKYAENVFRDSLRSLPFHGLGQKMLLNERTTRLLPFQMRGLVVG